MLTVRGKHPMKAGQIDSGLRNQSRQLCDEVERLEDDVRGTSTTRCLQRVADVAIGRERETLFRHRRAADVTAQPFELLAFIGLGGNAGM